MIKWATHMACAYNTNPNNNTRKSIHTAVRMSRPLTPSPRVKSCTHNFSAHVTAAHTLVTSHHNQLGPGTGHGVRQCARGQRGSVAAWQC